jgi:hypothetical protein
VVAPVYGKAWNPDRNTGGPLLSLVAGFDSTADKITRAIQLAQMEIIETKSAILAKLTP